MTSLLRLESVFKTYKVRPGQVKEVLSDVSFELARGRVLGIIGPNGSGKTTLLRIISGVTVPDRGTLTVNGRVGALLEVGAGFHPDLTGLENIYLNGSFLGLGRRYTEKRLPDIIAMSGLERFMDMPVRHYSSGMVVRLGFAIASQMEPDLLLLDETFAVGDAQFQARALGRIRELRSAGVAQILVSHNAELLAELSDRVAWLEHGRIVREGEPSEIVAAYLRAHGDRSGNGGGDPEAIPVRSASLLSPEGGRLTDADETLELESSDRLELVVEHSDPNRTQALEIAFHRDDGRTVASARIKPVDQADAGPVPWRIVFDPIRLAEGTYSVSVASVGSTGRYEVPGRFRIRTPLPADFRIVADLPGRWSVR